MDNTLINPTAKVLVLAGSNYGFRGVVFAPVEQKLGLAQQILILLPALIGLMLQSLLQLILLIFQLVYQITQ